MKRESKIKNILNFFEQTIKYPELTGAVLPSSKNLSKLIIKESKINEAKVVVEVGPGTGVFTKCILKEMRGDSIFFVIEINENFVKELKKDFPNLTIFHNSAEDITLCLNKVGVKKCDRVISGIPWTALEEKVQNKTIEKIHESLNEGGLFLTICYSPFNHLPQGKLFKQKLISLFKEVKETKIVANIPPAFVYICKK